MKYKPGGLLERAAKARPAEGICETCGNLAQFSETALACVSHDKFIIPQYPPYHGNCKCKDWQPQERRQ